MPKRIVFVFTLMIGSVLSITTSADFIVTVDPDDLEFTGPGVHAVDLFLSFESTVLDTDPTLDLFAFDITNAVNATVVRGTPATGIDVGMFGAVDINIGDQFAISNPFLFTIPTAPGVLLATLEFNVLDDQDFTIGLAFTEAARSFTPIDGSTAGDTGIVTMPSSFTVSASAIPEPSSFAVLTAIGLVTAAVRRRKRKV